MKTQQPKKSSKSENLVADAVIIGGGAGLAAAIAAAEKGVKVILLEKLKKTGGNAALAVGFLATESPVQKRLKIDATKEHLFKASMDYARWLTNPRIVKAYIFSKQSHWSTQSCQTKRAIRLSTMNQS